MSLLPKPAKQRLLRRGTTAEHTISPGFIGAEAELTYDTDLRCPRIHDGCLVGGYLLVRTERDGSIKLGQFTIGANGTSLTSSSGQANVRWQSGQMQFYDAAGPGWRAFGCENGLPVFGTLLSS